MLGIRIIDYKYHMVHNIRLLSFSIFGKREEVEAVTGMKQISLPLLVLILFLSTIVLTTNVLQIGFAQNECIEEPTRSAPNDIDGDGILNAIEDNGLDINRDGEPEINFTALGGNKTHKDIYLKIDYMKNHKPSQEGLDMVIQSFCKRASL